MAYTYADFITDLRADCGDFPQRRFETADGDAQTSVFQLQNPKVLDDPTTYSFSVGGVVVIEGTAYNQFKDIGQVVFTTGNIPAAGNDNISFQYQSVNATNADWINIINQVLQQLRKKIWIEFLDQTSLTSVKDQFDYDLGAIKTAGGFTDIPFILDFEYQPSTTNPPGATPDQTITNPWRSVKTISNVIYYKDLQKIHMRPAFNTTGFLLRVRGLRAYNLGTATTSPFELQTRYWPAVKKLCHAIYLERQLYTALKQTTAVSKEKFFENMEAMTKIIKAIRDEGIALLKEVRPPRPAIPIPTVIAGMHI